MTQPIVTESEVEVIVERFEQLLDELKSSNQALGSVALVFFIAAAVADGHSLPHMLELVENAYGRHVLAKAKSASN